MLSFKLLLVFLGLSFVSSRDGGATIRGSGGSDVPADVSDVKAADDHPLTMWLPEEDDRHLGGYSSSDSSSGDGHHTKRSHTSSRSRSPSHKLTSSE